MEVNGRFDLNIQIPEIHNPSAIALLETIQDPELKLRFKFALGYVELASEIIHLERSAIEKGNLYVKFLESIHKPLISKILQLGSLGQSEFSKIVCPTAIEFLDKIESPQLKARFVFIFSIIEIARSVETLISSATAIEADLSREMNIFISRYYLPVIGKLQECYKSPFSLNPLIVNLISKTESPDTLRLLRESLTTLIGNDVDKLKFIILADGLDQVGKNELSSMFWNRRIDLNAISTFYYGIVMKIYPAKYSSSHWFRFDVSPENRYLKQLVQIQKDDM